MSREEGPYIIVKLASRPTISRNRIRIGNAVVELSAIEFSITFVQRPISDGQAGPWVLMRQRHTLYQRVAGVTPNNLWRLDPESAKPCCGICHRLNGPLERPVSEGLADSGVWMQQRGTLYR